MPPHRLRLRTLCEEKSASHKKTNAAWLPLEQSESERQKVDGGLLRAGWGGVRVGELLVNGCRVSVLQGEESSGDEWWWLHNSVDVPMPRTRTLTM